MTVCDNGHDEICYEGGPYSNCPLCEANEKIEELETENEDLKNQIEE